MNIYNPIKNSTFINLNTINKVSLYRKPSYLIANTSALAIDYIILPESTPTPLLSLIFDFIPTEYYLIMSNNQIVHEISLYLADNSQLANDPTSLLSIVSNSLHIDTSFFKAFLDDSSTSSTGYTLLAPFRLQSNNICNLISDDEDSF